MELPEIQTLKDLKDFLESLTEEEMRELRFSQAMELVETISNYFDEQGDEIDIEDAIELYEKGMDLLMFCREKLAVVQSKKEEIDKKYRELLGENG
ncbi:exodeoxyribonuclease VII small subunit [Kosmotoga pacifica]|nr:exodeoxyribonuclease VII small subunit [Kosmotoga pacifica]